MEDGYIDELLDILRMVKRTVECAASITKVSSPFFILHKKRKRRGGFLLKIPEKIMFERCNFEGNGFDVLLRGKKKKNAVWYQQNSSIS